MSIGTKSGALPKDGGGNVMQLPVKFRTNYNQKSPFTISSVELAIDIPENCSTLTLQADGADLRVAWGPGGTAAAGTYDLVPDGTRERYPVAGHSRVYLLRNASTDVTCYFTFWFIGTEAV